MPRRPSDERMFSKRLFADREKSIAGTNSLVAHGLGNRRSRAGHLDKAGSKRDDDAKNRTTMVFPTIENVQLDMWVSAKLNKCLCLGEA